MAKLEKLIYHNKTKQQKIKKYNRAICLSREANAEAFLRIVLTHLKKMILDGLIFSEIDIIANDYSKIYNDILNETAPEVKIGYVADKIESSDYGKALEELGFNRAEMQKLMSSIKQSNERSFYSILW